MIQILEDECNIKDHFKCGSIIVYLLNGKKYTTHVAMADVVDLGCTDPDCDCHYCQLSCNGTCRWAPCNTEGLTAAQIEELTTLITDLLGGYCCGGCV